LQGAGIEQNCLHHFLSVHTLQTNAQSIVKEKTPLFLMELKKNLNNEFVGASI
jgi:hypothetical protein